LGRKNKNKKTEENSNEKKQKESSNSDTVRGDQYHIVVAVVVRECVGVVRHGDIIGCGRGNGMLRGARA